MIVTLEETKEWLRVEIDEDDNLINSLIAAAEQYLFNATGVKFGNDNELAKLYCKTLVAEWYDKRGYTSYVNEKIRDVLKSIINQLTYCYVPGVEP